MKIKIIEQHDGELAEKAEDVVRVVERLTGRVLLKAAPEPDDQIKQTAGTQFEYKAMAGAVKRSRKHVDRIKTLMDRKIAAVLEG